MMVSIVRKKRWIRGAACAAHVMMGAAVIAADAPQGAPIPPPPPFTSPDIKPTLADWLLGKPVALAKKIKATDPLQRPAFANAPPDSLKGMAAGIRAVQLDAPNRAKAAAYLGTLDCVTYPQAQEMLIATMQEDPSEEVRYEAVMALRALLSNGCTNTDTSCQCVRCENIKKTVRETEKHSEKAQKQLIKESKGEAKKAAKKAYKAEKDIETRYDCCRGCCNAKALNALSKVAFEKDEQCCWAEPSERVRAAAAEGLCLCSATPGYAPPSTPPVEPKKDEPQRGETGPPVDGEVQPRTDEEANGEAEEQPIEQSQPGSPPEAQQYPRFGGPALGANASPPVIPGLKGYCIVALKDRQFVPATEDFASTYDHRTYYFSSPKAKQAFDAAPENYALQYRGLDPVIWQQQREMVPGEFLREFEGQFYLFSSKENWETFKAAPQRFVLDRSTTQPGNKVSTASSVK